MRFQRAKTIFNGCGEAAFCEGSREAPGCLCKKLLRRSFLLRLVRDFFASILFSINLEFLASGLQIICPLASKHAWRVGISDINSLFYSHGVLMAVARGGALATPSAPGVLFFPLGQQLFYLGPPIFHSVAGICLPWACHFFHSGPPFFCVFGAFFLAGPPDPRFFQGL